MSAVTVAVCVPNPRMRKENPEEPKNPKEDPKSRGIPKTPEESHPVAFVS